MKYFVYILKSIKDSSFYIGYTKNLDRRLSEHNEGRSRYTARKAPWKLYYFEEHENKRDAIKRELFLKRQRNITFFEGLRKEK